MEIDIHYPSWHVEDGDRPVRVGGWWRTRPLLQAPALASSGTPDNGPQPWSQPPLQECPHLSTQLQALPDEHAGYWFVADTLIVAEDDPHGPITVLETPSIRFALGGSTSGRVCGAGVLVHDTHIVEDVRLLEAVDREFQVTRVRYLPHVYESVAGREGDFVLVGYEPPVGVETTHTNLSPRSQPGGFLITVETATTRPPVPQSGRTDGRFWRWLPSRFT